MRTAYFILLLASALVRVTPAVAAEPIDAHSPKRAAAAAISLRAALASLRSAASLSAYKRAVRAVSEIDAAVDQNYHAPNLMVPETRVHARALRSVVQRFFASDPPLLVVEGDVIRYDPEILKTLSDAAGQVGREDESKRWLRRAERPAPKKPR